MKYDRSDAFIAKAGITKGGGKCGRGWIGVKGNCKRGKAADQSAALKEFADKQRAARYGVTVNPSPQQKKKMAEASAKSEKGKVFAQRMEEAKGKSTKPVKEKKTMPKPKAEPKSSSAKPITSQKDFNNEVSTVFKQLNSDYNHGGLVPIHEVRKAIGERVSRQQFSDWLNEMQAQDKATLIGGEMPSITPEIARNSVMTKLGAPRFYMKLG